MNLFDASALLASLLEEEGSAVVEEKLHEGGVCGAANWAEVAQKVRSSGRDWVLARALLASYGLRIEPVTVEDAELAAALWTRGSGHSLGDRLCLALARRLEATVWTADSRWGSDGPIEQIR